MKVVMRLLFSIGIGVFIIGVFGGNREPFIPSDLIWNLFCVVVPICVTALCLYARFSLLLGGREFTYRRFVKERGNFGAFNALFLASFLIIGMTAGMGAIGWSEAMAYVAPLANNVPSSYEATYLKTTGVGFKSNFSALISLEVQFMGVDQSTSFTWPKKDAEKLELCPEKKIVVSGKQSVFGMIVTSVICRGTDK
jgi:hypothetical protein